MKMKASVEGYFPSPINTDAPGLYFSAIELHVSFVSLRILLQLLRRGGGEGEERRSRSHTKANLFVSKEKLLAPLPDEGINKIWRHLDIEREGSGDAEKTRREHTEAEFNRFLSLWCDLNVRVFLFRSNRTEGMNENAPLCDALDRCSLGMLRSRNCNHFPWKSPGLDAASD